MDRWHVFKCTLLPKGRMNGARSDLWPRRVIQGILWILPLCDLHVYRPVTTLTGSVVRQRAQQSDRGKTIGEPPMRGLGLCVWSSEGRTWEEHWRPRPHISAALPWGLSCREGSWGSSKHSGMEVIRNMAIFLLGSSFHSQEHNLNLKFPGKFCQKYLPLLLSRAFPRMKSTSGHWARLSDCVQTAKKQMPVLINNTTLSTLDTKTAFSEYVLGTKNYKEKKVWKRLHTMDPLAADPSTLSTCWGCWKVLQQRSLCSFT